MVFFILTEQVVDLHITVNSFLILKIAYTLNKSFCKLLH